MLILKKVAITGGISSGKTTLCQLFKSQNSFVINSDEIVHQLLDHNQEVQKQVIQLLGDHVVKKDRLCRKAIAEKVFDDFPSLHRLEKILHPHVREEVKKIYKQVSKNKKWKLFVVEIPLLFETGAEKDYDITIAIKRPYHDAANSFRDPKTFANRSKRLWSDDERASKADFVIENRGNMEDLKKSFKTIYSSIT